MAQPPAISRRFPAIGWAWPSGALDLLIRAAVCPDPIEGRQAFLDWLATNTIDSAGFREHRLLASISERYGKDLSALPEHARLVGLQRHLWTRSRMALADALPVLKGLGEAGVSVMLIKGGSRIAAHADDQRARVAHDLDILVPPADFARAIDILSDLGWGASSGESRLCLKARAGAVRAMNFYGERFGDIDLHQWGFGAAAPLPDAEAALWQNARSASFFGVPVQIPSPTDRLALAICHSGLDAHAHSDWLVDCAQLIVAGEIDWERLLSTLAAADALVPAQVALSYLHDEVGLALPDAFLSRLLAEPAPGPMQRISDLLQAKPRAEWRAWSRLARGIAKQLRLLLGHKARPAPQPLQGRIRAAKAASPNSALATHVRLRDLPTQSAGATRFHLELEVHMPGLPRRVEFELNTETRHLARLRARSLRRLSGAARISFDGEVDLPEGDYGLWLEARPGRHARAATTPDDAARYAALRFLVVSFTWQPVAPAGQAE
ncbi:MAG: nucleotidyltransferase family protein [Phaeovulum sp.]|uniref:nucleotidyltransferase family protein n=1 Tax=Phaeovulum sp. TaxID=2934796 RepID=UPI0027315531|nr:nucleotidyltransferase family protein [Phaeovulum sp.]MDP2062839.1 nucleotidyltransferase family protein [Phaeovulum sp.]